MTSFVAVYRDHFNWVWSIVRRLGVSPAAAEDVTQEIFMVIHARLDSVERPEVLRSWIYGIARRTVNRYHRAQRTRATHLSAFSEEATGTRPPTPLEHAEHHDKVQRLFDLLDKLDATKREVFMMVELDELSVPEVAAILEIPLNTAYSRLRGARQDFREALARSHMNEVDRVRNTRA